MTATAVKERPILFSGPMVKAILEGRKSQTRRVVSARNSTVLGYPGSMMWDQLQFDYHKDGYKTYPDGPNSTMFGCGPGVQYLHVPAWAPDDGEENVVSYRVRPVYKIGQRLWVRETWADVNSEEGPAILYRADGCLRSWHDFSETFGPDYGAGPSMDYDAYPGDYAMWWSDLWKGEPDHSWKPSIFMPRWASRITLEITEVRVQRLNSISDADCYAEGLPEECPEFDAAEHASIGGVTLADGSPERHWFHAAWDKINRKAHPWSSNPWVWAISFRKVD